MRRLITLSLLALMIGLTGYQASASNERATSASVSTIGTERGASAFPTGTWNAGIQVQNPTSSPASVQVKFYDAAGALAHTAGPHTIAAGASRTYYLPDAEFANLPNGKYSGVVESDQAVVAVVNETNYSGAKGLADAYNGVTAGATTLNMPLIFRNYGSWDSMIALQNTDASTVANVSLNFYETGSASIKFTKTDTIPALASKTYDVSSTGFDNLGATFLGSLTITSNTNVAAVAHSVKNTSTGELTIYRAFSTGSNRFLAPLIFNQYSPSNTNGWTSGIQVQNLGATADTITLQLTLGGTSYTKSKPIAANGSVTFYLPEFTDIPAGTVGSAVISSGTNNVVAMVNTTKYATGVANAYNAFVDGSGSTRAVAPLVFNQYSPDWITGIQVMNVGTASDTITMVFKPTNASAVSGAVSSYTKTLTVAPNASGTFYLPDFSDIPAGLYGSADITSTSQKIIAVINTTKYSTQIATTYTGINQN